MLSFTHMKNITTIVFGLLILPSVSFAAPLTTTQANSLISVVQSSTTTPASAFVPLITAFSNITVPQAESLINVIQQSPSTPSNAFVGMLLAFTVDPVPSVAQQTTVPQFGSTVIPTSTPTTTQTPVPVVQSLVMTATTTVPQFKLEVLKNGTEEIKGVLHSSTGEQLGFMVNVRDISTNEYLKEPVTITTDNPDLPSSFAINAPGQVQYFCVAPTYEGFPNNGCKNDRPLTKGTFNFTFTVGNVSRTIQAIIK